MHHGFSIYIFRTFKGADTKSPFCASGFGNYLSECILHLIRRTVGIWRQFFGIRCIIKIGASCSGCGTRPRSSCYTRHNNTSSAAAGCMCEWVASYHPAGRKVGLHAASCPYTQNVSTAPERDR